MVQQISSYGLYFGYTVFETVESSTFVFFIDIFGDIVNNKYIYCICTSTSRIQQKRPVFGQNDLQIHVEKNEKKPHQNNG